MELAQELEDSLQEFLAAGPVEICENAARVTPRSEILWELGGPSQKLLRHLAPGDFTRYGYFPGLQLQATAPNVYLVAPALRFSSSDGYGYLTPELEVVRVGLAESWRRGMQAVMRQ